MGNKDLIRKMGDMVNVPKDVTHGFPYLSILGNSEMYIENYKGILEYTRENIRIQTALRLMAAPPTVLQKLPPESPKWSGSDAAEACAGLHRCGEWRPDWIR